MKRRLILYIFLLFGLCTAPVALHSKEWTERSLGKLTLKAGKAAHKKNWARAIKYGEQTLEASNAIDQHHDPRYINLLKNLNRYYDKAGRLGNIGARVIEGYQLSKKHLGPAHPTTMTSRHLYYKFLVSAKNYPKAISLALENISLLNGGTEDSFRRHHYLTQLYSLYGLTAQLNKEEATLLQIIRLNKQLFDSRDEDQLKIIAALAKNYCRQKKTTSFKELITTYHLNYTCK